MRPSANSRSENPCGRVSSAHYTWRLRLYLAFPRLSLAAVTAELSTIIDFIRYGASRFAAAELCFGHSYDNAMDEATHAVLQALNLPHDLSPAYGQATLVAAERKHVLTLIERRVRERKPIAYLTGQAWFAGLKFKSDERALVPRSPIAESIQSGFSPWTDAIEVQHALDLCCGGGCIGIAMAAYNPTWQVDVVDISDAALSLARENILFQNVGERVSAIKSDLFAGLKGKVYDLIVSNPPYVTQREYDELPPEYDHEPALGLKAGVDGLDFALRILADAPAHLSPNGCLIVEVGESETAVTKCLPKLPLNWIEFEVGQMGVFTIEREDIVKHMKSIRGVLAKRD